MPLHHQVTSGGSQGWPLQPGLVLERHAAQVSWGSRTEEQAGELFGGCPEAPASWSQPTCPEDSHFDPLNVGRPGAQGHPPVVSSSLLLPQQETQSPTWTTRGAGQTHSALPCLPRQPRWFRSDFCCPDQDVLCASEQPRGWHHAPCTVWALCDFVGQINAKQIGCEWMQGLLGAWN